MMGPNRLKVVVAVAEKDMEAAASEAALDKEIESLSLMEKETLEWALKNYPTLAKAKALAMLKVLV